MMRNRERALRVTSLVAPLVLLVLLPWVSFPEGKAWVVDTGFTAWAHSLESPFLTAVMKWVSAVAYHNVQFWIIGAVALYFLIWRMQVLPPLALLLARYGGLWLSDYLKDLFARPRPQLDWLAKQSSSFSYPSGTVIVGATFYIMLAYIIANEFENQRVRRGIQASGWLFAGIICFSRIYLGAHWLTDTLAGLCLAATITTALSLLVMLPLPQIRALSSLAAMADMRKRK